MPKKSYNEKNNNKDHFDLMRKCCEDDNSRILTNDKTGQGLTNSIVINLSKASKEVKGVWTCK